ncbi:putative ribonuclease H-like domain-containing protein [Tanacetum coccineum]|uniref:Ribonuclease H-like domain-containing protein n=1 Tax=Tanacetum coccineum TaxID=301880 RepID=A0ABQ5CXB9_9ASTR
MTHPHPKGNFVPKAVLMKSGLKTLNTARQNSLKAAVSINTAKPISTAFPRLTVNCARSASNVFYRAHSHVIMPFNKFTTNKNNNFNEKVNTIKGNITTARLKAVVSDNKGNKANVVKASACWEELKDKGVINSGCFRHMTGNRSYFINYEEINGGFVAFGGSTKGGKITRNGLSRKPALRFMRPFGCPVTILNTIDHLDPPFSSSFKNSPDAGFKPSGEEKKKNTEDDAGKKVTEIPKKESGISNKEDDKDDQDLRDEFEKDNAADEYIVYVCADDPNMPNLEEIVFSDDDEGVGVEDDMTNLDTHIIINPIPTTRIYKDNPVKQIIGDIHSPPQTRRMTKSVTDHIEPKKTLVDLPYGKRAIRTKWVYRNKKVERGIVVRNKARLVAQCYTQEEVIDYDEVFAPVCPRDCKANLAILSLCTPPLSKTFCVEIGCEEYSYDMPRLKGKADSKSTHGGDFKAIALCDAGKLKMLMFTYIDQ